MGRFMLAVVMVFLSVGVCQAERVYVRDKKVSIPVETRKGEVKVILDSNGEQTWVYNRGRQTDIVHPDGTTTSIYGMDLGSSKDR